MSNKGLKAYTKQITQTLADLADMSINLNKNDANLHISIPLISSIGLNQIKPSLIFNYQDIGTSGLFGRGFKLNYYAKLSELSNKYTINNADGSIDEYLATNSYENEETKLRISKVYDDAYCLTYHYEVHDKYDNVMKYYSDMEYPRYIRQKNGERLTLDFIAVPKKISNEYSDEIRFTKTGNVITKIAYYHSNSEIAIMDLEYSNDYLTKLTTKYNNVVTSELSISYSTNNIIVLDTISGQRIKYIFSSGRVTSYIYGYDANFTNSHPISISYQNNKTTVSDYLNNETYIFFDNNDFPLFEMDSDGNVVETEFDIETKLLISKSNPVQVIHKDTNLFPSSIANFSATNVSVEHVDCDVPFFSNILGNTIYKAEGTSNTAKLTYSINIDGLATDDIFLCLWGKQLTAKTNSSYVKVTLSIGDVDTDIFKKESVDGLFDLMTLGVSAKKTYSNITVIIELKDYARIELGGLQVIRKSFGSFYEYDDSGNTTEIGNGGITAEIKYNSNNLPSSSIGGDSSMYDYEYDDYGNVKTVKSSYGTKIVNTYDTTYKANLINNKISTRDGTINLETRKDYSADGRFITKEYDELLHETAFLHDSLGRITKVTNALNVVTDAIYNNDGTINQLITSLGNSSSWANYSYDNKKRLTTVTLKNLSAYSFSYDGSGNINQISLNNNVLFIYNYDSSTGNIISLKYGTNGDLYRFEYNSDGLIIKTYYEKNSISTLKYEYEYNVLKQLTTVKDGSNNILVQYQYDSEGRIIEEDNNYIEIKKQYDNLGNVNQKSIEKENGYVINQSFDSIERSKGAHPEALLGPYTKDDLQFVGTFMSNSELKSRTKILKSIDHSGNLTTFTPQFDGIIPYLRVDNNNLLSYQLAISSYHPEESGCVQFWFKPYSQYYSTQQYLFSCQCLTGYSHIGLYLSYGLLYLYVIDTNGLQTSLITSDYSVNIGQWNFVALTFMNRYDEGGDDVCEYGLILNGHTQVYKKQNPRIYCEIGPYPIYNIGHNYNGLTETNTFYGDIACLFIGARKYSDLNEVRKYYRTTKDYFIDNELIDSNVRTVDFSETNYYNISQTNQNLFEIFPLHGSIKSLKGVKPVKFTLRNVSEMDKDRTFNFNKQIKRYAYVADGEELVYLFGTGNFGTIMLRAITDSMEATQYLFELVDDSSRCIGLYRGSDSKLYINFNGSIISTDLTFTSNVWHTVSLSFKKVTAPSALDQESFRIILDDSTFNYSTISFTNFGVLKLYVGRQKNGTSHVSNLGDETNYCPLLGQIEMLAIRNAYCEDSTLNTLKNELVGITKTNEFNELGMLKKICLHKAGTNILSTDLSYKKRSTYSNFYSKEVASEKIKINDTLLTTRNYETDALGNITSISDSIFGNHQYEYDYRGFLTKDDGSNITYDDNGNITSYGSTNYSYSSTIKDLLISVGNKTITYDNYNLFNPISYDGKSFEYEGRRLTKFTNPNNLSYNYEYNDKGLRIKKTVNGAITHFSYDSDKLVSQKNSSQQLDFLYDENNSLYGFILNNDEKYFYIRDTMQNILGIINDSGTLVVKYSYNAYGNILSITGSLASTIGIINPFRYKGYYYDEESGMYYCISRYYVPEWCRWLNADNSANLDYGNCFAINLFCYCNNNPICMIDPSGKIPWWGKLLIGIGIIAVLAVATIATAGIAGVGIGTAFAAGFSGVAIGAGVSGAAVTVAASAFSGAVIAAGVCAIGGAIKGGIETKSWKGALEGASSGFMMGSITGAIFGGISGGINYARTTPLFRTISKSELNNIKKTGTFSTNGSMEIKWFATTKANASKWAKWFGQNDYVGIRVAKNVLGSLQYNPFLDSIGPAYCIDIDFLNAIVSGIWFF